MSRRDKRSAITGLASVEKCKKKLQKFLKSLEHIPLDVMEEEAQQTYLEAVAETPYDTGKLEDSVYVRVAKDKRRPGFRLGAQAINPDTGENYAYTQHESPHFNHPVKGKAFYLRDPFRRAVIRIRKRTMYLIKKAAKRR